MKFVQAIKHEIAGLSIFLYLGGFLAFVIGGYLASEWLREAYPVETKIGMAMLLGAFFASYYWVAKEERTKRKHIAEFNAAYDAWTTMHKAEMNSLRSNFEPEIAKVRRNAVQKG
jgi:hypothetical protein